MGVVASQITCKTPLWSTVCLACNISRWCQISRYWPFVMESQRWLRDSRHKVLVTRKPLQCHDVIMDKIISNWTVTYDWSNGECSWLKLRALSKYQNWKYNKFWSNQLLQSRGIPSRLSAACSTLYPNDRWYSKKSRVTYNDCMPNKWLSR